VEHLAIKSIDTATAPLIQHLGQLTNLAGGIQ